MESISKEQLLAYGMDFPHCCLLYSNDIPSALAYRNVDWIAAFGHDSLELNHGNAFETLQHFYDEKSEWLFGFLGYDLKNELENLNSANIDGLKFPELCFFRAEEYIYSKAGIIKSYPEALAERIVNHKVIPEKVYHHKPSIQCRMSRSSYIEKVKTIKEHLANGDIYELNLCMEFFAEQTSINPEQTWLELNTLSPMPFAGFYKFNHRYLLCASPERFLLKKENKIISQPIKGTARRSPDAAEDERLKNELYTSEKERSENVMIVDLTRNDLAKSAITGTVKVEELFGIYTYNHLHQMISTVSAEVKPGLSIMDIIRNAYPMGSMTGCPKIEAMKLIDRYEESKRGVYSGALGYISPEGDFDFNVVIRSILYNSETKYLSFQVGSAITWHSDPEKEYEECLLKAKAMMRVLGAEM